MKSTVAKVHLSHYEEAKEISQEKDLFINPEATANPVALVFSNKSDFPGQISLDLFYMANSELMSRVRSLDSIEEFRPNGAIDPELKDFFRLLTSMNEWLLNSSSVKRSQMKDFHSFDRIELKNQLQRMANAL